MCQLPAGTFLTLYKSSLVHCSMSKEFKGPREEIEEHPVMTRQEIPTRPDSAGRPSEVRHHGHIEKWQWQKSYLTEKGRLGEARMLQSPFPTANVKPRAPRLCIGDGQGRLSSNQKKPLFHRPCAGWVTRALGGEGQLSYRLT